MEGKKNKKPLIVLAVALAFAAVALIVVLLFMDKDKVLEEETTSQTAYAANNNQPSYIEHIDVDKYFEERAEIISILSVKDSEDVLTLENVIEELESRGFTDIEVTPVFTMNGVYLNENEASEQSSGQYPMYTAQYVTPNGEFWTISVINNQFTANPVSYQLQSDATVSILISEEENIISYDSIGNRFFIIKPYEDSVTIKIVDRIDSATLDALTAEEIENL